jgi:hypothetical protein
MKHVGLVVDPSSISMRASGPATGNIALAVGGITFPTIGWNDFIVVVLEAWLGAILRIVRRTSNAERVHFMEGPYVVDLTRLETGAIQVRAIDRPNRQRAIVEATPLSLVDNAIGAADGVLAFCRERDFRSVDVDRLYSTFGALRREVASLTS